MTWLEHACFLCSIFEVWGLNCHHCQALWLADVSRSDPYMPIGDTRCGSCFVSNAWCGAWMLQDCSGCQWRPKDLLMSFSRRHFFRAASHRHMISEVPLMWLHACRSVHSSFCECVYLGMFYFLTLDHWPKSWTHFLGAWFTMSRLLYWQRLGPMTHMWAPWLPDMALLYHLPRWAKRSQRSLEAIVCYVQPHVWYVNHVHTLFQKLGVTFVHTCHQVTWRQMLKLLALRASTWECGHQLLSWSRLHMPFFRWSFRET